MENSDTEACSGRASLATASIVIPTDSRRAAPHCHAAVIALSTAVMRFCVRFRQISQAARRRLAANASKMTEIIARAAGSGLRKRQRCEPCCSDPEQWPAALFINSKPQRGLSDRGDAPLSGMVAPSGAGKGIVARNSSGRVPRTSLRASLRRLSGLFDNKGGSDMRVLGSRC
jgi:hypothetical protein